MLRALSTPTYRLVTLILLTVSCVATVAALLVGIDDNPPGFILAFLAATAFILAFVHPWRASRRFAVLLGGAILAFMVLAVVHNLFDALDGALGTDGDLHIVLQGVAIAAFFGAVLICPPACLIGLVGTNVMGIRSLHMRHGEA